MRNLYEKESAQAHLFRVSPAALFVSGLIVRLTSGVSQQLFCRDPHPPNRWSHICLPAARNG